MIRSIIFASVRACQNDNCLKKKSMHQFEGKRKIEFQDLNDAIFSHLHRISLHPPAFQQEPKTAANVSHPEGSSLPSGVLFSFLGLEFVNFRGFWRTHWSGGASIEAEIVSELGLLRYHIQGEPEGGNPRRGTLLEEEKPQLIKNSM